MLYLPKLFELKKIAYLLIFLLYGVCFAQDDAVAKEYFNTGEFEKALIEYSKLLEVKPNNINYALTYVKTLRQLERYDEAEEFLLNQYSRIKYPGYLVEIGYNYQLKGDERKAETYFNEALTKIDERPSTIYSIARYFEDYSLLDYALTAYKKALDGNTEFNFDLQIARIYADQGNIEQMLSSYVDYAEFNPNHINNVKRALSDFLTEDPESENNLILKKGIT